MGFKRVTAPPRTNPGLFASARVGLGGLFCFLFATIQRRLGPPRRVFVVASPFKVLHLSLSSDGWGQWICLGLFLVSKGGNAVRFCHFVFFRVWLGVLCRFFSVLLFLGLLLETIFGSELFVLGFGVGRVYFVAVLPMFLLYYLVCRSRKCLEKILFWSGPSFA